MILDRLRKNEIAAPCQVVCRRDGVALFQNKAATLPCLFDFSGAISATAQPHQTLCRFITPPVWIIPPFRFLRHIKFVLVFLCFPVFVRLVFFLVLPIQISVQPRVFQRFLVLLKGIIVPRVNVILRAVLAIVAPVVLVVIGKKPDPRLPRSVVCELLK